MREYMATQPDDEELVLDQAAADQDQQDDQQRGDEIQQQDQAEDEEEIVIGGDPVEPAENDSALIRHLRSELKRTRQELSERPTPQPQPIEVGPEPDLWEDCEGDPDRFKAAILAREERQRQADAQKSDVEKGAEAANKSFAADVERFNTARASLKVPAAGEAIDTALSSLSPVQQAALVTGADNAALVLAALGKHPGKLAEIAGIENPIKFAAAVAKWEGTLKVQSRQRAPAPEQVTTGNASVRTEGPDKTLERLEAEAARNGGDRSKIIAYKAGLKKAGKA
jgi:hypothetical protein